MKYNKELIQKQNMLHLSYIRTCKTKDLYFVLGCFACLFRAKRHYVLQEQALIGSEVRRRTATVICCENSELLTIDSENFENSGLKLLLVARIQEQYKLIRFVQKSGLSCKI